MQKLGTKGAALSISIMERTPTHPISSSYEKARCRGVVKFISDALIAACNAQATKLFISAVPLPYILLSLLVISNAGTVHD